MPLRICPNQRILFIRDVAGQSIAVHGFGTEVKRTLVICPVLDDLLPRAALPPQACTYLWQGTLVEEKDPESEPVQNRYWVGTVVPLSQTDVTVVLREFGDPTGAEQILIAALHAASKLERSE